MGISIFVHNASWMNNDNRVQVLLSLIVTHHLSKNEYTHHQLFISSPNSFDLINKGPHRQCCIHWSKLYPMPSWIARHSRSLSWGKPRWQTRGWRQWYQGPKRQSQRVLSHRPRGGSHRHTQHSHNWTPWWGEASTENLKMGCFFA